MTAKARINLTSNIRNACIFATMGEAKAAQHIIENETYHGAVAIVKSGRDYVLRNGSNYVHSIRR